MTEMQSATRQPTDTLRKIPVDADHGGIRLLVVLAFIAAGIGGYALVNAVIPNAGISLLAILSALFIAWAASQLTETLLRGRWKSGRYLVLQTGAVQLTRRTTIEMGIQDEQPVQVLMWRFVVKQRARVPRGWIMLACALEQNDVYLPIYTFVSPEHFDQVPHNERFAALISKKDAPKTSTARDVVLSGQQRRLYVAEQHRWMDGAEVTRDDFMDYLDFLQGNFSRWMPPT
jgi:hypothetical protein